GHAICAKCGEIFTGKVALCDACGSDLGGELDAPEDQAVRAFARVPGMSEGIARRLYVRGFRDFADVIKLGLPESAVKRGLHHTISRKILLRSVVPKAPHRIGRTTCVACHTNVLETETKCPACGAALGPDAEVAAIEKRLAEVQGSLVPLAEDPDFRSMPDPVRQEILREISTMLVAPSPPS